MPRAGEEVASAAPPLEVFPRLAEVPGLLHGVSTRAGGVSAGTYAYLNMGGSTGDDASRVMENRRRVAEALGVDALRTAHQVHGADVARLATAEDRPGRADAILLTTAGVGVGVLGADCPGVLLVAPRARALAVVHAGWRGVVAGVVTTAVRALVEQSGEPAAALLAGIGPGIGPARYEVDAVVAGRIAAAVPDAARTGVIAPGRIGHAHADLVAAVHAQLRACGLPACSIERHGACTYDDPRFFSHRRDAGVTGRHALVAAWR